MDRKKRLLKALKGLEMTLDKKEEFVDLLLNYSTNTNSMEYYSIPTDYNESIIRAISCSSYVKIPIDAIIYPSATLFSDFSIDQIIESKLVTAIAIDTSKSICIDDEKYTAKEVIDMIDKNAMSYLTPITKEEFYDLPMILKVYEDYENISNQNEMKTNFDILWNIWKKYGVENEQLNITFPIDNVAYILYIEKDGTKIKPYVDYIIGSEQIINGKIVRRIQVGESTFIYENGIYKFEYV